MCLTKNCKSEYRNLYRCKSPCIINKSIDISKGKNYSEKENFFCSSILHWNEINKHTPFVNGKLCQIFQKVALLQQLSSNTDNKFWVQILNNSYFIIRQLFKLNFALH